MKKLEITLETVTPMFLGGAEAKTAPPELRPPAFRGAMRYWFRATAGGVIGDKNLDGLHKLETAVFGSPETGSPISISLAGNLTHSVQAILPHKPNSGRRETFDSFQHFQLIMRGRPGLDDLIWGNACRALNLTLLFGGVGLRSRRGFGSLRIIGSSDPAVPTTPETQEKDRWAKRTMLIAQAAIDWTGELAANLGVPVSGLPTAPTDFPCAAKDALVRIVTLGQANPNETLEALMSVMPQVNWLGGISPRQSSPLWMRVFWADNSYHLLLCLLPSKLARSAQDYGQVKAFLDRKFPGVDLKIPGWNV